MALDVASTTNQYYWEITVNSGEMAIGIAPITLQGSDTSRPGSYSYYGNPGSKFTGTSSSSYGADFGAGDVIGVAVGSGKITFYKNGASQGDAFTGLTGIFVPFIAEVTCDIVGNFGQSSFAHTPPSGFVALSTANLPNPAIDPAQGENPTEYFNTVTYSGTSGDKAVTGVGFQPDWVWIKQRNSAADHQLYDSVRGVTKLLESNKTTEEQTKSEGLKSFDSDGFTHGVESAGNDNSGTHVAWNWKAGTSFSNDASATGVGTIDSTGSVSTEAGFSIVSYTGTGSSGTIAHGLGVAPAWFFVKNRDDGDSTGNTSASWIVYHQSLSSNQFMKLETNDAVFTNADAFGGSPSSTTIQLGTFNSTNGSGDDMICYAFAEKEGYSKFGIYDDNFVSDYDIDSPYVYTGFRPAWLMIKGTSAGRDWVMYDNKRTPDNGVYLRANEAGTEQTDATNHDISFLSNGFKIRGGSGDINTTNESYIYMAFADQPFKFANGGTE
jgi:hypothetical protein